MIWLVVLTFFVGTASVETRQVRCATYECVENIMAHTRESRTLIRLRVFHPGNNAGFGAFKNSIFDADTDLLFN